MSQPHLKPYPHYKDSDIAWLGEVPTHWGVKLLKHIVSTPITDGPHETPNFLDEGIPFVSAEAISSGYIDFSKIRGFISREEHFRYSQKYRPQIGDIYMIKSGATTGITAIVETDVEFNIWSPLAAIRCDHRTNARFVLHFMRSRNFQEAVTLNWSFGTQQNIGMGTIENLAVAFPPIEEQTAIAEFLDRETGKIDELVVEQRRLIDLLKEKRQAVISHAVTKGLNPNAPMKDSGIEWLGQIPAHWALCALNYRYDIALGKMLDEKRITGKNLAPYLRNVDVQWNRINIEDLPEMDFEGDDLTRYALRSGDLLVCEGGEVGRAAIWQGQLANCFYQKALHRIRPRNEKSDTTKYLYFVFYTAATLGLFSGSEGRSTIAHLPADTLRRYRFVFPTLDEQYEIVEYLTQQMNQFDDLTTQAERAIELLQERRTALISAAVTGKIDVRQPVKELIPA